MTTAQTVHDAVAQRRDPEPADVRHAPGVVLQLRYSNGGRQADLQLDLAPDRASGRAAARLVRAAVAEARAQGIVRVRTGLDYTTPYVWEVLDALREGDDADVRDFAMHRAGSSVMVDTRLQAPRSAALHA